MGADSVHEGNGGSRQERTRLGFAHVYQTMREDILWLRLKPGAPLDESALASRFRISRTPIREALRMLAGEDLVTLLPQRTSIVAHHSLDNLGEYLDALILLSRAVTRSAAHRRTDTEIAAMRAASREYAAAIGEGGTERILRTELALCQCICRSAHNEFLAKFYRLALDYGIRQRILHYIRNVSSEELAVSAKRMCDLVEAIASENPELSDSIIVTVIDAERSVVERSLEPRIGADVPLSSGANRGACERQTIEEDSTSPPDSPV